MRQRGIQIAVFVTCVVATAAAGGVVYTTARGQQSQNIADDDLVARLRQLRTTVEGLQLAQAAAVTTGQPRATWLERCDALLAQSTAQATAVRALIRASAPTSDRDLGAAIERLGTADAAIRRNLDQEESVLAADVVFGDASAAGRATLTLLDGIERSSRAVKRDTDRAVEQRQAAVLIGLAAFWTLGGLVLLRSNRPIVQAAEPGPTVVPVSTPAPSPAPAVDLERLTALCTSIGRLAQSNELPGILARAADVLGASGLAVWVVDGEQLSPALAHGYSASAVQRFGQIPRDARNPTAEAWRAERLQVLPATDGVSAALAAPMLGPQGCVGVLAIEMRTGRATDAMVCAAAGVVAAQLATVVAPSSVASGPDIADQPPLAASGSR